MAESPKPSILKPIGLAAAADARRLLAGATTDGVFNSKSPAHTGNALDTPSANEQYSIETMVISLNGAGTVTLHNAATVASTNTLWGPHAFAAAGVFSFVFPRGLKVGAGLVPLVTTSAGNGTIDITAVRVAAT